LLRRKWWVVGTFLVCTVASLAYALQQERVFAYTTSIELGEFGPDEFVASASAVRNTVEDRILLSAKRAFLQQRDELNQMPFDVSVQTQDDSSFVNLVSEAPLDRQDLVADFHEMVYQRLRDEHQSRLAILEEESDSRLETLEEALESEQRRLQILEGMSVQTMNPDGGQGETRAQAQGSDDFQAGLASTDAALTMLLSQLQLNERISEREKRINELRGELREEQTRRSWIKPTRAEDLAVASLSPVGTGRSLIVVLGALLGGMLGVFLAFMAEFATRVRASD